MKALFFIALSVSMIISCKKDKSDFARHQFYGSWEYENYSGYPFNNNYLPPGNGRIIMLSEDGIFERRQHDTLLFKGTYTLQEKRDCHGQQKKIFFSTDDPSFSWESYIDINSSTGKLTLTTSNCLADGGTVYYRKI